MATARASRSQTTSQLGSKPGSKPAAKRASKPGVATKRKRVIAKRRTKPSTGVDAEPSAVTQPASTECEGPHDVTASEGGAKGEPKGASGSGNRGTKPRDADRPDKPGGSTSPDRANTDTDADGMPRLSPVMQKFILHWGEMGTRWGINRTVAQIHALLYIWPDPLNAEQITKTLSVARSNVSTSLRELQSWGIVRVVHVLGDRRDHFESMKDVWEMFQTVLSERKRREIDPTLLVLRECVDEVDLSNRSGSHTHERLSSMLELVETMSAWHDQVRALPTRSLIKFLRMGSKLKKLLGLSKTK